jgi:hypothetical protein
VRNKSFRKYIFIFLTILKSGKYAAYYALFVKCLSLFLAPLDYFLFFFEKILLSGKKQCQEPIIFVVGIHRTGSTYVSQVLCDSLDVVPMGNFFSLIPRSKYLAHLFGKLFFRFKTNSTIKKNYYGISTGFFSIGDVYEVWDRWFGKDHYCLPKEITSEKDDEMQNYFYWVAKAWGKSILSKNNRNTLLIERLYKTFPKSYFIVVERNPTSVIMSTMQASKDFFGGDQYIWGLLPRSDFSISDYENKVTAYCNQYFGLEKEMNKQLQSLSKDSFSRVKYEEFCLQPEEKIREIVDRIKYATGKEIQFNLSKMNQAKPQNNSSNLQLKTEIEERIKQIRSL